jgi:hypothetical protein
MGLNLNDAASIYQSILAYRRPRELDETQAAALSKALAAGPARHISISAVMGDQEGLQYATELHQAIAAGGWKVDEVHQVAFSNRVVGVLISVGAKPPPPAANELFQALRAAGLAASGNFDPNADAKSVLLMVGAQQ